MLKKLTIRNFKAIQDMTIEFTPLTVLIGENACGKSTVLQALDFLRSAASRDILEYLRERKWPLAELKNQCNDGQNKPIEFVSLFEFVIAEKIVQVEWLLLVNFEKNKWVIQELININGESVISYGKLPIADEELPAQDIPNPFKAIKLESSLLKIVDDYLSMEENEFTLMPIMALKDFLKFSSNYELLSPELMRSGIKYPDGYFMYDIGMNGRELAQCIKNMPEIYKKHLDRTISEITSRNISVRADDSGNKIEILLDERVNNTVVTTNSSHISDGLLRLMAFFIISQDYFYPIMSFNDRQHGIISIDEIENGINPYITEKVINLLRIAIKNSGKQIIVTTHSPVIVNDFNPEEIVFLWKDKNGSVHSRKFFDTEEMKELLEALNPGEVWINLQKDEILEKLSCTKEETE